MCVWERENECVSDLLPSKLYFASNTEYTHTQYTCVLWTTIKTANKSLDCSDTHYFVVFCFGTWAQQRAHTLFLLCVWFFFSVRSFFHSGVKLTREKEREMLVILQFWILCCDNSSIITTVLVKQRRIYYNRNWVLVCEFKCCIFDCTEEKNTRKDLTREADTNIFWRNSELWANAIAKLTAANFNLCCGFSYDIIWQQGFCWCTTKKPKTFMHPHPFQSIGIWLIYLFSSTIELFATNGKSSFFFSASTKISLKRENVKRMKWKNIKSHVNFC